MSTLQPPPTWALPVIKDKVTGVETYNPIWINWFLELARSFIPYSVKTNNAATYTVTSTDTTIVQTTTAAVYTLPSAALSTGRKLDLVTQFAGTVTSASANVIPRIGGVAGTAILPATAGAWAVLQSNGISWVAIAGS